MPGFFSGQAQNCLVWGTTTTRGRVAFPILHSSVFLLNFVFKGNRLFRSRITFNLGHTVGRRPDRRYFYFWADPESKVFSPSPKNNKNACEETENGGEIPTLLLKRKIRTNWGEKRQKKDRNCILFIFAHFLCILFLFSRKVRVFFCGCIKAKGGGVGAKGEEEEI